MNKERLNKIKKAGWEIGSVKNFLDLTNEEIQYIETKLALTRYLKDRRKELGYTQEKLAEKLGSSQSRVAKMEAGDENVSIDLLLRAIYSLKTSGEKVAEVIARK